MERITNSALGTQALAKEILQRAASAGGPVILALEGELGAGKTTFTQGLGRELGIAESVLSPTFVIMKRYRIKYGRFENFYHFDCYRLESSRDLVELGFEDIISNDKNIIVLEWAEKVKNSLPPQTVWVKFEHLEMDKRKITFEI